jgi:hypothetical protein
MKDRECEQRLSQADERTQKMVAILADHLDSVDPKTSAAFSPHQYVGELVAAGLHEVEPADDDVNVAAWPPDAAAGGEYLVQRAEAIVNDPRRKIVLPENFTLRLAPDVTGIDWTVKSLRFGRGCTLDLAALQPANAGQDAGPSDALRVSPLCEA